MKRKHASSGLLVVTILTLVAGVLYVRTSRGPRELVAPSIGSPKPATVSDSTTTQQEADVNQAKSPVSMPPGRIAPALNTKVNESAKSVPAGDPDAGITREEAAKILPLYPSQLRIESAAHTVVLTWRGTGEDVTRYNVYRKAADGNWRLLGRAEAKGDNTKSYEFTDSTTRLGIRYTYSVAAVSNYGTEGARSNAITIDRK